jgi:flagellar FliJ protein
LARDPLDFLLRLRRVTKDEAKRAFAAGLVQQTDARRRADAADALLSSEGEMASDLNAGDGAVEAYVKWLPVGRHQAKRARMAHDDATADVIVARAALTVAHAAAEAASTFLERRAAETDVIMARRAQAAMDEVAARPARGNAPDAGT